MNICRTEQGNIKYGKNVVKVESFPENEVIYYIYNSNLM